jgi:hypothetical protein
MYLQNNLVAVCENVDPEGEDVVQENLLVAVEDLEGFAHARAVHHARRKDAVRLCAKIKRNGVLLSPPSHFHANGARAARGSGPFVYSQRVQQKRQRRTCAANKFC